MRRVYAVIGCPGSGKTWICDQVKENFNFVHHDLYIGMAEGRYVEAILEAAPKSDRPLLIEIPFSINTITTPLRDAGFEIVHLIIQEPPLTIAGRYYNREKKKIPQGHLTRMNTYNARALENGWLRGSTEHILEILKGVK